MANIKSAKKRILVNRNKAFRNQMQKSQLKTVIKKFNNAVESGDKALATELTDLLLRRLTRQLLTVSFIRTTRLTRSPSLLSNSTKWHNFLNIKVRLTRGPFLFFYGEISYNINIYIHLDNILPLWYN